MGFWTQYHQRHPAGSQPPVSGPYVPPPPYQAPPPYQQVTVMGTPVIPSTAMTPEQVEQNFQSAIQSWQGNPRGAAGERLGPCPHCGSPRFFSRTNTEGGGLLRGMPPAPHCADCGYPVLQAGSSTISTREQASAPVHQARMLPGRREPFQLQLVR